MVVVVRPATRASCTELKSGTVVCSSGIVDGGGGKSYPPFFEQAASIAPARNISSTTAADRRIVSWKPARSVGNQHSQLTRGSVSTRAGADPPSHVSVTSAGGSTA